VYVNGALLFLVGEKRYSSIVNPFRHMFMNIFDVSKCAFMTIKSAFNERDDSRASGRQIDFLLAF